MFAPSPGDLESGFIPWTQTSRSLFASPEQPSDCPTNLPLWRQLFRTAKSIIGRSVSDTISRFAIGIRAAGNWEKRVLARWTFSLSNVTDCLHIEGVNCSPAECIIRLI